MSHVFIGLSTLLLIIPKLEPEHKLTLNNEISQIKSFVELHQEATNGYKLFLSAKLANQFGQKNSDLVTNIELAKKLGGVPIPILKSPHEKHIEQRRTLRKVVLAMKTRNSTPFNDYASVEQYVRELILGNEQPFYLVTDSNLKDFNQTQSAYDSAFFESMARLAREDPKSWPGNRRRRK